DLEGDDWPDLADAALAASAADWLAPALLGKTTLSALASDAFGEALHALLPWPMRRRLDAEAPSHFTAPSGASVPRDYAGGGGAKARDPRAGAVRARPPSRRRGLARAAGARAAVTRAAAGAGDARPPGVLARQLRRGEKRDERPLSAPSLARRSACRSAHPA